MFNYTDSETRIKWKYIGKKSETEFDVCSVLETVFMITGERERERERERGGGGGGEIYKL